MCMVTFDPRRYIWLISLINVDILFWCPMEWLCQHVQYAQHVREDTAMCEMQEAQQVFQCSSNTSACVKLNSSYLNFRMYDTRFLQRAKHKTVPGESTHQHKPENDREGDSRFGNVQILQLTTSSGDCGHCSSWSRTSFPSVMRLKLGNLSLQVFSDLPTCG